MSKVVKLDLLIALYIFCILVSELLGAKTFALIEIGSFQLNASVAIFVLPLIFTINDIVTEVHGKERARSIIKTGMVVIFLVFLFSILAVSLPPSVRFAPSEAAYDNIFGKSIRISAASLIAFTLADFLDVYIFSSIRKRFGTGKLWLRNNLSNFISQFVDTTLFITLAFYSLNVTLGNNFSFLVGLILPYWLLKCTMSIFETPFAYLGTAWLRKE